MLTFGFERSLGEVVAGTSVEIFVLELLTVVLWGWKRGQQLLACLHQVHWHKLHNLNWGEKIIKGHYKANMPCNFRRYLSLNVQLDWWGIPNYITHKVRMIPMPWLTGALKTLCCNCAWMRCPEVVELNVRSFLGARNPWWCPCMRAHTHTHTHTDLFPKALTHTLEHKDSNSQRQENVTYWDFSSLS